MLANERSLVTFFDLRCYEHQIGLLCNQEVNLKFIHLYQALKMLAFFLYANVATFLLFDAITLNCVEER